jgi:hypothetical protein
MPPIKLPPTPWSAYDEQRPANTLLLAHVRELERAVRAAGRRVVGGHPRTEGEVAAYIRQLNRALHNQVLLPALKRRPLRSPSPVGTTVRRRAAHKPVQKARAVKTGRRLRAGSKQRRTR